MSADKSIKISPVQTGNMRDKSVLLDAPRGKWLAQCLVEATATKPKVDDGNEYPMLKIGFKLLEDLTGGNETFIGRRVTTYLAFFPPGHKGYQPMMRTLHGLCKAADVPIPDFTSITEWPADGQEFIDSIDRAKFTIWTNVELDRKTQQDQTVVKFEEPRVFGGGNMMPLENRHGSDGE